MSMGNDEESMFQTGIKRSRGLLTYAHPSYPPISRPLPLFRHFKTGSFRFSVAVEIMDLYLIRKLFVGEFVVVDSSF